jgi:hypothetical protein
LGDFKKSDEQVIYLFDNDMSFEIGGSAITENMIFVGDQDIEDSISNEIWLALLNDYYHGVLEFKQQEIQDWKTAIVKGAKCDSNDKFYSILKNGIKEKCKSEEIDHDTLKRLPSKGADSAEFLIKHLNKETIPAKIKEAFEKLNQH